MLRVHYPNVWPLHTRSYGLTIGANVSGRALSNNCSNVDRPGTAHKELEIDDFLLRTSETVPAATNQYG